MTTRRTQSVRRRVCRLLTATSAALLLSGAAAIIPRVPLLLYNRTPSMPIGVYVRVVGRAPQRGDAVAFTLPAAAQDYARRRGERSAVLLLKHVLAIGGDRVCTLRDGLTINGIDYGPIADVDGAGRPLPQWRADRVLAADELLAGSTRPRSFDGRYFGPVRRCDVLGVYRQVSGPAGDD